VTTALTPTIKAGGLSGLLEETPTPTPTIQPTETLDLANDSHQTVTTANPKIKGQAPAKVKIKIVVNSNTQIEQDVYADENGAFQLDIATLSQELEPGEHTVEYSYIDPDTGEEVTELISFTVAPDGSNTSNQIAQADISATPTPVSYGTENPYPDGEKSASESATASESAEASTSATASESATKGGISTRSALPSTESGMPVSGSVGTTLALILGGLFFIIAGIWSFWIAGELNNEN